MNRNNLLTELAALEQYFDHRVAVWRRIIDANGREIGRRIYRGSFRSPIVGEHSKGATK